jgi:exodeoxyribonuclease V gamma subunit
MARDARPGPATVRGDKLLATWLRGLACAAAGLGVHWRVVGTDAVARLPPLPAEAARLTLQALLAEAGRHLSGHRAPATAARTGLAWLADAARARITYDGQDGQVQGERAEACLARLYPHFEVLSADPHFEADTRALYAACRRSLDEDWVFERHADAGPAGAPAGDGEGGDG